MGTAAAMTIEENLALAELRGRRRSLGPALTRARRDRYRDLLARFRLGLEDRLSARTGLLSGGQRQSLALVMAVATAPRVLLLDEHTAALDPRTAVLVLEATVRVVAEARLTTLMVTHDMRQAVAHGDRLLMMADGRIVLDAAGPAKAALTVEGLVERFHRAGDAVPVGG
jgi:putative ABC transport system ATP-binding protein